jgi:hypothetical protein
VAKLLRGPGLVVNAWDVLSRDHHFPSDPDRNGGPATRLLILSDRWLQAQRDLARVQHHFLSL